MFNSKNLSIVSKYYYGSILIVFCIQIIISDSFDTVFVIFLLTISNIVTTYYCFNKKYFFQFPISLFIIFISNFMNFGGVLFIKTYELSPVTDKMFEPINTMVFLFIVSLLFIATHYFYMKSYTLNKIKGSINNFFIRIGLFEVGNNNCLYFISTIGIISLIFFSRLDVIVKIENVEPALYQDLFVGLNVFHFALIIALFSSKLNNISQEDKKNWIFILGLLLLMFASFASSIRALFFDFILTIFMVYAFLYLLGLIEAGRYLFFKFILMIAIVIPSLSYIEHVSDIFLLQKHQREGITRLENFKQTLSSLISPSKQKEVRDEIIELNDTILTRAIENKAEYFENKIFTRFNVVPQHDFFYFISEQLTKYQIKEIKKDFAPRIISLIPQPLISLFSDFNKRDYLGSSIGSYISGFYDATNYGPSQNTSSMLVNVKIYFGFFWPLALIILSIISFTLFDSFCKYEKKIIIISPILVILFYSSGSGLINFFAHSSFDITVSFLLRTLPQTIILYIILKFFYQRVASIKKL